MDDPPTDSGWTLDTLKELVEQRIAALERLGDQRAVEVQHTYVPREVFEASTASLAREFEAYKATTSRALILREGKGAGVSAVWAAVAGGVVVLAALVAIYSTLGR